MAMTQRKVREAPVFGRPKPRIAPPTPARSDWKELHDLASRVGIEFFPWQDQAARFLTAKGPGEHLLYPEVAVIVGRQNGKTTLLPPLIISRLLAGKKIMHTAQNRELPRETHDQVGTLLLEHFPRELPARRGIRYGAGQEEIRLRNGARYRIVAPTKGGARGPSNDLVIIDELREMDSHDFISAAEPTLSASSDPQMVYLSNAGTEDSEVLNAIKRRADSDPALAYLEWSASPNRTVDDLAGWMESNPAIGHLPGKLDYLTRKLNSYRLAGTMAIFETEHLCRWVTTMQPRLVTVHDWAKARSTLERPRRPVMGISQDPSGTRASAVIAWQQTDGTIGCTVIADVTGDPIDVDRFGADLRQLAIRLGVSVVAFDSLTDAALAKHFEESRPIVDREYANATARFATIVAEGRLRWDAADQITDDLMWVGRRPYEGSSGAYRAIKAKEDRPATAVFAAIRAVFLASGPKPAVPKVM